MAVPSLTPLPVASPIPAVAGHASAAGTAAKRPTSITFSEMEVPQALRNKYVTMPAELQPASMSERINIATGLVEKPEGDAEVKRILAEADVFVKYGLIERAADHLRRVFDRVPTHQGAHERLAAVLVQLGRKTEAAAEYETLAHQFQGSKPQAAADYARKALDLNPGARRALEVLGAVSGSLPRTTAPSSESSISMELRMGTPEPDIIQSEEIEVLEGVEPMDSAELEQAEADGDGTQGEAIPQETEGGDTVATSASERPSHSEDFEEDESADGGGKTEVGGAAMPEVEAEVSDTPSEQQDVGPELEQIDFFIEQGVVDEASSMLDEVESNYPGHPELAVRRQKLAALQFNGPPSQGAVPARPHADPAGATQKAHGPRADADIPCPKPTAQDLDTHVDLGIMEKTMERYDAAIEHFKVLMAEPKREVFALSMIGECHEALGDSAEAIRCYQDALKRPSATAAEATQLYYQLGNVFHNLGDQSEALYYFERVYKRDASFRDIQQRLAKLKAKAGAR
jgi:tetratricopeptide (TPR) repeat protein